MAIFIDFSFFKDFLKLFNLLLLWLCLKPSNNPLFQRALRLLKGLWVFLPHAPGAMLIQGATFIPDSRVYTLPTAKILSGKNARAWISMVLYFKK